MKRMKINILGMIEVRWQGVRRITLGTFKIFYSRGTQCKRGVAIALDGEIGKTVKGYWPL